MMCSVTSVVKCFHGKISSNSNIFSFNELVELLSFTLCDDPKSRLIAKRDRNQDSYLKFEFKACTKLEIVNENRGYTNVLYLYS